MLLLRRLRQALRRQLLILMARRPALLCGAVLLGVLMVLAVKFTCGRAKNVVAPARPPVRFFSPEAPVLDLYLGQIDQVERLRSVAEVSLLFLYAPWCAHSMAARQELQLVAHKLSKQVQFVAVNCWWSQGRCRKQRRLYHYPSLQLFYRRFGPIEYKGPLEAPYVESFILKVLRPFTYLPSVAALRDFLSHHEPRVVGFFQFNTSPQPPGFLTYVWSALQALHRDFRGAVRFGVVTSRQVAQELPVPQEGAVYLHRSFNTSLVFPRAELNFTSHAICAWVYQHYHTVVQWLQPPGTKSRLLEVELRKGPALLLFLPHDPLEAEPSALQLQVESLAVRYHSCARAPCCHSLPVPRFSAVCELCREPVGASGCPVPPVPLYPCVSCSCVLSAYHHHYIACCHTIPLKAPANPGPASTAGDAGITGLRCLANRTLRFYLLDAKLNWPLALRLGATHNHNTALQHTGAPAFASIVDLKDEQHYVLQPSSFTTLTQDLESFIMNFSTPYSPLRRHLTGQQESGSSATLITDVTCASFRRTVLNVQQDVLLLYYTQWCGFCSVLHHLFVQLARLLQGNTTITVARVNVALNDLPWEFMVDRVPTVLLFPRYRKHQSVKFPVEQPLTLPNLLRFVLRSVDSLHSPEQGTSRSPQPPQQAAAQTEH